MVLFNALHIILLINIARAAPGIRKVYNLMLLQEGRIVNMLDYWSRSSTLGSIDNWDRYMQIMQLPDLILYGNFRSFVIDSWQSDPPDEVALITLNTHGDIHAWMVFNTSLSNSKEMKTWMTTDRLVDSSFNNAALQVKFNWTDPLYQLLITTLTYHYDAWFAILNTGLLNGTSWGEPYFLIPNNFSEPFNAPQDDMDTSPITIGIFYFRNQKLLEIDLMEEFGTEPTTIQYIMVTSVTRSNTSLWRFTLKYSENSCNESTNYKTLYQTNINVSKEFETEKMNNLDLLRVQCIIISLLCNCYYTGLIKVYLYQDSNMVSSNRTVEYEIKKNYNQTNMLDIPENTEIGNIKAYGLYDMIFNSKTMTMTLAYTSLKCTNSIETQYEQYTDSNSNREQVFSFGHVHRLVLKNVRCLRVTFIPEAPSWGKIILYKTRIKGDFSRAPLVIFKGFWYNETLCPGKSLAKQYFMKIVDDFASHRNTTAYTTTLTHSLSHENIKPSSASPHKSTTFSQRTNSIYDKVSTVGSDSIQLSTNPVTDFHDRTSTIVPTFDDVPTISNSDYTTPWTTLLIETSVSTSGNTNAETSQSRALPSTRNLQTTSTPVTSTEKCKCPVLSSQDVPDLEERLKKELAIDKKSLSSHKRSRVSAMDNRPSAQYIGYTGGIVLSLCCGFIILSDILSLAQFLSAKFKYQEN